MDIRFDCSLQVLDRSIEIAYTLRNHGAADVGVFNRIESVFPDGTLSFSPDTVYLEIEGEVLLARKAALPIPEGLAMAAYVPPSASRLAAGGVLTETVSVPIPVRVMQPFKRAMLKGQVVADVPATVTSVVVGIGVFPVEDPCRLSADQPAFPDVYSAFPPGAAVSRQQILSKSFVLRKPLAVLDYRAVPW